MPATTDNPGQMDKLYKEFQWVTCIDKEYQQNNCVMTIFNDKLFRNTATDMGIKTQKACSSAKHTTTGWPDDWIRIYLFRGRGYSWGPLYNICSRGCRRLFHLGWFTGILDRISGNFHGYRSMKKEYWVNTLIHLWSVSTCIYMIMRWQGSVGCRPTFSSFILLGLGRETV